MDYETLIKLIFAVISTIGSTILMFSIVKLRLKDNHAKIAIFGVVVGAIIYYFKFVVAAPPLNYILYQVIANVILFIVIFRFPLVYSLIISCLGFIATALGDSLASTPALQLKLTSIEQMNSNVYHYITLHAFVAVIYILISYILKRYGIGFNFIVRKFSGGIHKISFSNFLWSIILIIGVAFTTFLANPEVIETFHMYIILIVAIIFIISITYSYFQYKQNHSVNRTSNLAAIKEKREANK